jgi:hypothetical protein
MGAALQCTAMQSLLYNVCTSLVAFVLLLAVLLFVLFFFPRALFFVWPASTKRPQFINAFFGQLFLTMAGFLTSCPHCMESCCPFGPPGTSSFAFNLPAWSIEYVCGHCGDNPWFECCHVSQVFLAGDTSSVGELSSALFSSSLGGFFAFSDMYKTSSFPVMVLPNLSKHRWQVTLSTLSSFGFL